MIELRGGRLGGRQEVPVPCSNIEPTITSLDIIRFEKPEYFEHVDKLVYRPRVDRGNAHNVRKALIYLGLFDGVSGLPTERVHLLRTEDVSRSASQQMLRESYGDWLVDTMIGSMDPRREAYRHFKRLYKLLPEQNNKASRLVTAECYWAKFPMIAPEPRKMQRNIAVQGLTLGQLQRILEEDPTIQPETASRIEAEARRILLQRKK